MQNGPIQRVSVVLPVYNEQENLPFLFQELRAVADRVPEVSWDFLFVDDGSQDGSAEEVRRMSQIDARVKGVVFDRNYGQTAAMSCGIRAAQGDVIVPMDADRQNDPADILKLLEKINEGYTCVSGWRKDRKDTLVTRKLPSWMANALISWMTGVSLHDYGCSLKAYRRDIIKDVELYGEMHRFIPAYAASLGAKVTEVVVNHRPRVAGKSKYGLFRVFNVLLDLIVVRFLTGYFDRPMHFFGIIGFMSFGLGIISEITAVVLKLTHQRDFISTPLPTVGAMLVIVGTQLVLFGLIAEVLMRTYFESQRRQPYRVKEVIGPGEIRP